MRVLAVDVATRSGFAVLEAGSPQDRILALCNLDLHPIPAYELRLLRLWQEVVRLVAEHRPFDAILYECPPGWHGKTQAATLRTLWQLAGVVQCAVASTGLATRLWGVSPTDWQPAMLGYRHGRKVLKALAREQVRLRFGLDSRDEDECDALLIAQYGLGLLRLGMLPRGYRV